MTRNWLPLLVLAVGLGCSQSDGPGTGGGRGDREVAGAEGRGDDALADAARADAFGRAAGVGTGTTADRRLGDVAGAVDGDAGGSAGGADDDATSPAADAAPVDAVAESVNRFACDLYAHLAKEQGNLFYSPYSISTALAMVYAGAEGLTEEEMARVLHFGLPERELHAAAAALAARLRQRAGAETYQLQIANRLWGQAGYGFLPDFLGVAEDRYGAGLAEVDFAADTEAVRAAINAWVEEQTHGKIADLIPPGALDPMTRLVLTNAVYFKGQWSLPFEEGSTADAPFHLADGTQADVPLMHQRETFRYYAEPGLQALEMSYEGGDLSMVVLLPEARDGLAELEARLSAESLSSWTAGLAPRELEVFLPRFRMTSEFELSAALAALGMPSAFDRAAANLLGMATHEELYIAAVLHKAYVDVNEEGTEAAAATGVTAAPTALPPEPDVVFRADHPFLFAIRDTHSGAILFMGRVEDPR